MKQKIKYELLFWGTFLPLLLSGLFLPLLILRAYENIFGLITLFLVYGIEYYLVMKSRKGKIVLTKYEDWIYKLAGIKWICDYCQTSYDWKDFQPILSYVVQPNTDYYVSPTSIKLCHSHFKNMNQVKEMKNHIDNESKGLQKIFWSRDGSQYKKIGWIE